MLLADNPELFAGGGSFGNLPETFSNQSILSQNESAFLEGFFQNPENMDENIFNFNESTDQKVMTNTMDGGGLGGFEQVSGAIDNPASTLGITPSVGYQSHTTQNHMQSSAQTSDMFNNHVGQEPSDEYRTAATLFRMSNGHGQSQASAFSNLPAGSWGTFSLPVTDHLESPLNSSGRQSTSSYPASANQTPNPFLNHQTFPNVQSQSQAMQQWQYQHGSSRPRPNSFQIDTNSAFDLFPDATAQMHMSQSAHPYSLSYRPQPPMRFGSDSDFGHNRYRAPGNYVQQEHEKAANLNNVPLAAQAAAATGQQNFPGITPPSMHARHSLTSAPPNFHSTSSSPSHIAGLPQTKPMFAIHQPLENMRPMAHRTIEPYDSDDEDDEVQVDEQNPRKRRQSQMERDEDAEYSPSKHMKGSIPKRGPKVPNAVNGSDDDDASYSPSINNVSHRRRKSTLTARVSIDSSDAASPSAMSPPARPTTAGGRKKSRHSQSRQNLSHEQKRQNHIASEKHRRDLIKGNYSELDDLVPALARGTTTLSRADQLNEIVKFVESITAGNAEMARRLGVSGTRATTGASVATFG